MKPIADRRKEGRMSYEPCIHGVIYRSVELKNKKILNGKFVAYNLYIQTQPKIEIPFGEQCQKNVASQQ